MKTLKNIFIVLFTINISSCVDKIDNNLTFKSSVLTVQGLVSDKNTTQILINQSISSGINVLSNPINGCKVELIVNNSTKVLLTETEPGVYLPPVDFIGIVGNSYQLIIKTPNGENYESSVEKIVASPPIKNVYQKFIQNGQLSADGKRVLYSTFDVFVDFDDNPNQKNFYVWEYDLYEPIDYCITCERSILIGLSCVSLDSRNTNSPTYDYICRTNCWDILRNKTINIFSDEYSNGKSVVGRNVAKIPYYGTRSALLEIHQNSVSREAYEYQKLLRDQTQTSGTLTDTPPAAIIGNIRNVNNPSEKVVGSFSAVGISQAKYVVDRSGYERTGIITSILGRQPVVEPPSPFRPPTMPCIVSKTRTTSLPK